MNISLARWLFFAGIAFTAYFFTTSLSHLRIATDLKDLSPDYFQDADAIAAADELNNDIQKRLLWLIQGEDKTIVDQANNFAIQKLKEIDSIKVTPDLLEFSDTILEKLLPYQFQLLSATQQNRLNTETTETIAKKAHTALFQLDASARLTTFDQDPLAWFNDYLIAQFKTNKTQRAQANDRQASQIISLSLGENANEMTQQRLLNQQMDELQAQVKQQFKVDIFRSGIFFFASDAAKKSKQDISLISTVSMVGVLLLLLIAFRSVRPLFLPFTSIALGVSFALSVVHSLYGAIHVLTIVFGASLIGIVIDYSLHYFYHVSDQSQSNHNNQKSLHHALLLSLGTSLIGYGALSFSGLEALQKVAVFSCCGLSMAWLSVICLGPFISGKNLTTDKKILPTLLQWGLIPIQYFTQPKWLAITLLIGGLSLLLGEIKTSDDPRLFFNASTELLAEEKTVRQYASEYEPGRYLMISDESTEKTQENAKQFFNAVDQTKSLNSDEFSSIFNWVPTPEQQRSNYALQSALYHPTNNTSASATRLLSDKLGIDTSLSLKLQNNYQKSAGKLLNPQDLATTFSDILPPFWFETEQRKIGLILISKGTDLTAIEHIAQSIDGVDYVNTVAATTAALSQQRQSASKLLILAYFLVALLLLVRYRKWQSLNLLTIPIIASLGFVVAFVLMGQTITLFHTMALFLVLGLGMDYGIFVHDMQDDPDKTRQAIFVSAITSILSFGLLALSSIPVVKAFGLTLLIGNSLNLIGALSYSLKAYSSISNTHANTTSSR